VPPFRWSHSAELLRGSSAGAGSVANGGQAGSGAVGGAGGIASTGGSGGAVATGGADASAASGTDATACFALFHSCANSADCCAPNRCLNITGTLACQQEGPAVGGSSTVTGGNGGTTGTGGASSSSSGNSCYDSSGTIATTAKTCTLASDCKEVVQPTSNCCGAIMEVGLAKSSSCTFPTPSCDNVSCPIFTNPAEQAEDGKNTGQGGSIGVQCVGGQCMTFVMAGGPDAGADANVDTAGPSCFIVASDYDQSCSADSDCVSVDFGNYCQWICRCGGDAINRDSLSQFTADTAMTPLGQGSIPYACNCGYILGPCCRGGQCTTACGVDAE
jgi:hypothetical protein